MLCSETKCGCYFSREISLHMPPVLSASLPLHHLAVITAKGHGMEGENFCWKSQMII